VFGENLRALFFNGQSTLNAQEREYYKIWVWLNKFGVKPNELENISVEDQNVIWTMLKYEQEKDEHEKWKKESDRQINNLLHPK